MPRYQSHVALVYGTTGQVLEFYPSDEDILKFGVFGSQACTYSVWRGEDGNDQSSQFSGTATGDTTSVTTDAAAGPSQARRNRVPLGSTTGVVAGRRYLMSNATTGKTAIVTVTNVAAGDYVELESDLTVEFASGTAFLGLLYYFTVDPTFIATSTSINVLGTRLPLGIGQGGSTNTSAPPFRVRWSYLGAGSLTRRGWSTFDVCRAPARHSIEGSALRELMPDLAFDEWAGQKGSDFAPQVKAAWERVKLDVRMAGYDVDMLSMDVEILDRLTLLSARSLLAQLGCRPRDRNPDAYAEECEQAYRQFLNDSITVTLKAWTQTDASGAIAPEVAQQLFLTR